MTDKTAASDAVKAPSLPLFYQQPRPLDRVRHAAARLLEPADLGFAAPANNLPVLIEEFAHAGHTYPIVFTLGDVPTPVALLGLRDRRTCFCGSATDTWTWAADTYIPAYVRRYPLILMEMQTAGEFTVCIDEAAGGATGERCSQRMASCPKPARTPSASAAPTRTRSSPRWSSRRL